MNWQKLAINALLAGLWAGVGTFAAGQAFTRAALYAAAVVAARTAIGYIAAAIKKPVLVDR